MAKHLNKIEMNLVHTKYSINVFLNNVTTIFFVQNFIKMKKNWGYHPYKGCFGVFEKKFPKK
jgi:hypothetical protein